jgi:hypothetical protein
MPMNEGEKKALDEEFKSILRQRKEHIEKNYPLIRHCHLTEYGLPELEPLRYEITLCLTFGLYQAALTLTNHLLESLLKCALSYHYALQKQPKQAISLKTFTEWFKEAQSRYNDKELSYTINQASTHGFITKEEKKKLHHFRTTLRNAYGHADRRKQFGNTTVPAQAVNFADTKAIKEGKQNVPLVDLPLFHGFFQVIYAEADAVPYYLFIDNLARHIIAKLFPDQKLKSD